MDTPTNSLNNYIAQTGNNDPFDSISVDGGYATPAFADIDGDGDLDLIVGQLTNNVVSQNLLKQDSVLEATLQRQPLVQVPVSQESISYYKNTGTATNPNYVEQTGSNNPFSNVSGGSFAFLSPSFGDVDADGDLDMIVADGSGYIAYYQNDGSATSPDYVQKTLGDNPFQGITTYADRSPALADIDDDGDADLVVDDAGNGYLEYFENTVTTTGPAYAIQTGSDNPFNGIATGFGYSAPTFVDFDGDGDLDALFGLRSDPIVDQARTNLVATSPTAPILYAEKDGDSYVVTDISTGPINGVRAEDFDSAAAVGDIDGDGDLDILVGDRDGNLKFYENFPVEPMLMASDDNSTFEVVSLGSADTLMFEIGRAAQFSDVLIFKVDDAAGSNPEQVGSFSLLESGQLEGSFAPTTVLNSDLVANGEFFQVQLVENGVARMAIATQSENGQLMLDFGQGTVLTIQPAMDESPDLLTEGAGSIDLGDSGNPMMLEFSVYREATFNNTVGLYATDTADGGIVVDELTGDMLMPGDAGYKEAVMDRMLDVTLTGENGAVQSFSADVSGDDQFIASFLIADGSDFNSSDVYFSHMGMNSNGNDHTKKLGNNTFGYEDMAGLGDGDYNDIVVQFNATEMQRMA